MPTQIINNGASLKIVSDTSTRYITKQQIKEIGIVRSDIIKLDLGEGPLYNVFIDHNDVTDPVTATPSDLRDAINTMLQSGVTGGATEAKQDSEIAELQGLNTRINDLTTQMDALNEKHFYEPSLVDETNPNMIYRGFADPGAEKGSAVWAIQQVENEGGIITYKWAGGNKNFDKIWDNREGLAYS